MGYRRLDDQTVVDEFGNPVWLPSASTWETSGQAPGNQLMDPGDMQNTPGPSNALMTPDLGGKVTDLPRGDGGTFGPGAAGPGGPGPAVDPANILARIAAAQPMNQQGAPGSPPPGPPQPVAAGPTAGPPGAAPPEPPPVAPAQPPITAPNAPTSVAQADRQSTDAFNQMASAATTSDKSALDARSGHLDQATKNAEQSVKDRDAADQDAQRIRQAYSQKADAETADWLQEMHAQADKVPDPKHYWHSASGFSKVLWLLSLATSAVAGGPAAGVVSKMLMGEVDKDVDLQKEQLKQQSQYLQTKGGVLDLQHKRDAGFAEDDITAKYKRLVGLDKVMENRNAQITDPDRKAQADQTRAALAQERSKLVDERWKVAHAEGQEAAGRSIQRAQMAQQREEFNTTTALGVVEKDLERGERERLALMAVQAKSAAALAKDPVNFPAFAKDSGVSVMGADGKGRELDVPKEFADKAFESVKTTTRMTSNLKQLDDKLQDSGEAEKLAGSDIALNQAVAAAIDPMVQQTMKRVSGATLEQGQRMVLGMDMNSYTSRIKEAITGNDKGALHDLLQGQIARAPEQLRAELTQIPGMRLRDGERIVVQPVDTTNKTPAELGPEATLAASGVPQSGYPAPKNAIDYTMRRWQDQLPPVPDVPTDISKTSFQDKVRQMDRASPGAVEELRGASIAAIDAWKAEQKDAGAKAQADDMKVRINAEADRASGRAKDALDALEHSMERGGGRLIDKAEARQQVHRAGLSFTDKDLDALVKTVNGVLARGAKRGETGGGADR